MTTPSGLPLKALQFLGAARGAVTQRASTADFFAAVHQAAIANGLEKSPLTFRETNQLRSAAVGMRNTQENFQRAPEANAIDASMIAIPPYARSIADQNALPIYQVGITLHTMTEDGEVSSDYRQIRFTGQLPATKADLLAAVGQDAEALADTYNVDYAGHDVVEILAI